MKCECGSTKMHRYFHYVSKGIERFRCLKCDSCYEVQGDLTVKLEMPSIDKKLNIEQVFDVLKKTEKIN